MIRHHYRICEEDQEGVGGEMNVDAVIKELYHESFIPLWLNSFLHNLFLVVIYM